MTRPRSAFHARGLSSCNRSIRRGHSSSESHYKWSVIIWVAALAYTDHYRRSWSFKRSWWSVDRRWLSGASRGSGGRRPGGAGRSAGLTNITSCYSADTGGRRSTTVLSPRWPQGHRKYRRGPPTDSGLRPTSVGGTTRTKGQ